MGNMKSEEPRISVRVDAEFKERIKKAVEVTGIEESTLVKRGVEALVEYIEKTGSISFPVEVSPRTAKKAKKTS